MKYKGVLLDFDGVVLKSMEQHYDAWSRVFAEKGTRIDRKVFYRMEGQGVNTIARQLAEHYNLNPDETEEWVTAKVRYYYQQEKAEFYPYFREMLKNLNDRSVPLAVVTGGNKQRVKSTIDKHLQGRFDALVSFDDVENGKPHPEPFLRGAEKLGLPASECIVIENAPLGIRSARDAGCHVIAITTTLPAGELDGAHTIVNDFRQAEEILQKLLALS